MVVLERKAILDEDTTVRLVLMTLSLATSAILEGDAPMLVRHLDQTSSTMRGWLIEGAKALEGRIPDGQLEVASQLPMAALQASRHRFEGTSEDRRADNALFNRIEEWARTESAALRFRRVQWRAEGGLLPTRAIFVYLHL